MGQEQLIIVGGGGHAQVVAAAAKLLGYRIIGHLALEASNADELGPYLGSDPVMSELETKDVRVALGVGFVNAKTLSLRVRIVAQLLEAGGELETIVHPNSIVAETAVLGPGCFVSAGAIVGPKSLIGDHAIVNTGAVVEHHCTVGRGSHVASGAVLGGSVIVGENVLIGLGANVRQGIEIGDGSIVSMGARVYKNIGDNQLFLGNETGS